MPFFIMLYASQIFIMTFMTYLECFFYLFPLLVWKYMEEGSKSYSTIVYIQLLVLVQVHST